jgi:hypothetical protein
VQPFPDKISIKRIAETTLWYNFISNASIPFAKTTTFQLKIVTTANKHLMVGVGSKDIFVVSNSQTHKENLCYYILGKCVYENGSNRSVPSNVHITNGVTLSIVINRSENTVNWKVGGNQLAEASIPETSVSCSSLLQSKRLIGVTCSSMIKSTEYKFNIPKLNILINTR